MTDDDCTAFVENHKLKIKKQEFVINVELSSEQSLAVDIYCDQDIGDGTDSGITTDNLANTTALESEYQCVMDLLATNLDILKAKHEYAELYLRTRRKHGKRFTRKKCEFEKNFNECTVETSIFGKLKQGI